MLGGGWPEVGWDDADAAAAASLVPWEVGSRFLMACQGLAQRHELMDDHVHRS